MLNSTYLFFFASRECDCKYEHWNTLNLQMGVSKGHLCGGFIAQTFNQILELVRPLSIPFPLQKDK
jgi:hypothetical protein